MEDHKMPLTEHLGDLRKRLIISFAVLFLTFLVAFSFSEYIFELVMFPLKKRLLVSLNDPYVQFIPQEKLQDIKLVFLAPAEAFWMHMKVAFVAGLIMSLPVIFFQVWKFVSPGLLQKERHYVVPFIFVATSLFLVGAAFCFLIVLPFALRFLLTYKVGDFLSPMLSIGRYVDFCLKFILAFGAIFELPVAIVFLARMGLVTPKTLAKNRKYAVLIAFIVAAVLTPTPDFFNQTLMAVPILVLYEVGIIIARIFVRRKKSA
jgi:sec-independent protein translocase protein TatC